jgi:GH25 family lysozyme M1 (1,4-beta-N-acetylmuramidase)
VTRLRRGVGLALSVILLAGLAAAIAVQGALGGPAALASATVSGTDIYGGTTVTSWPGVKSAGTAFVGIEAYDGKTVPNANYAAQVTGALGQGLYVMPYVFADPLKIGGAAQFANAWTRIGSVPGHPYAPGGQLLPVALDLEDDPVVTTEYCYKLTPAAMVSWIRAFIAAAEARTHVVPVIYTRQNWWDRCTAASTAFAADPLWAVDWGASSPALPSGWTGYAFWQDSGTGSIPGIAGPADLDQLQAAPTETARAGTSGSAQLETLNSLAGQPVGYAAASALPAGLTLTSAGRLSWSPAARIGRYQVLVTPRSTATPAAAVIPASIPVTLRVHAAAITLDTANRSSTAGTPVKLAIPSSGADEQAGFRPALTVTGLPPGLSLTSGNLVTGWLARPGTFTVRVTAADGLGGTGRATFTWTVAAAPDAGVAGPVRQAGGSGKCLNDPGGNTASGTRLNLWTCDGKPGQTWTTVQDGTLRTGGKCLATAGSSTASGSKLQLAACDARDGAQHWQAGTDGELVNPQSGQCLDVPAASAANGTQPVIEPCASSAGSPRQHWLRPAAALASGLPGTCAATASASAVVLTGCRTVAAQRWQLRADGTVRRDGNGPCLVEGGATVRSGLSVGSCAAAAARWRLIPAGPIAAELANAVSGLCASIPATGNRLVVAACAAAPATTWRVG